MISFRFGLFAPANGTVIAMLRVGIERVRRMFLILELDTQFARLIRMSSMPMDLALSHLGN